jgi:hypothetical protein
MKNKVAYTILFMVLSSSLLIAQKPSFDLLPSGKQNKIPEAIVDAKFYTDSASNIIQPLADSFQIEKKQSIFNEADESDRLMDSLTKKQTIFHEAGESESLMDSLARRMFYLIFTSRIEYSFSTLYRSFIKV